MQSAIWTIIKILCNYSYIFWWLSFFYFLHFLLSCFVYSETFALHRVVSRTVYPSIHLIAFYERIFVSAFVSSDFLGFLSIIPLKLSSFLIHDPRRRDRAKELGLHAFAYHFSLLLLPPFTLSDWKLAVVRITSNVHCITTFNISSKVTATD